MGGVLPAVEIAVAGEGAVCDPSGALYLPADRLLVVSDLHLEKGSSYARRGSMLPPYDTAATLKRLAAVIDRHRPAAVVSLGDSFHDAGGAGRMPEAFRERLLALMAGRQWYWISGNHDPLPPEGLPGHWVEELAVGSLIFRHEPSQGEAEGEIAGHLHPGARIVRRGRSVRRACFASDGARLVMPAFGSLTGTLNVLDRAFAGLFRREALTAYMLGAERVYPITGAMLRPA
ncbi:ligase-associated DNA damage response endonuclease PdeM [Chelativorans sp. EGI FJ00035]|uniref:Ligase-associated DNA damage response endonuclease PdeM n=2 Tax=Chelativorans salis TaxID=2978478 RepID=A0ABT2LJG7_9HYPH|nr:ligase-associated DNA damage response endonuclease PdeM [Chelativorans sp. EGI FJ00035]MCT7374484.1 ligase-associated DNA damage response endonuclease PdeM [Chelativorans sp. EGI FJ00035]